MQLLIFIIAAEQFDKCLRLRTVQYFLCLFCVSRYKLDFQCFVSVLGSLKSADGEAHRLIVVSEL